MSIFQILTSHQKALSELKSSLHSCAALVLHLSVPCCLDYCV